MTKLMCITETNQHGRQCLKSFPQRLRPRNRRREYLLSRASELGLDAGAHCNVDRAAKPAKDVDHLMKTFDSVPLFMTSLPEDGDEGDRTALEALQSLTFDGTPDGESRPLRFFQSKCCGLAY